MVPCQMPGKVPITPAPFAQVAVAVCPPARPALYPCLHLEAFNHRDARGPGERLFPQIGEADALLVAALARALPPRPDIRNVDAFQQRMPVVAASELAH